MKNRDKLELVDSTVAVPVQITPGEHVTVVRAIAPSAEHAALEAIEASHELLHYLLDVQTVLCAIVHNC